MQSNLRVSWEGVTSRAVGLVAAFTSLWVVRWRLQVLAGCWLRPLTFPYVCSYYITAHFLAASKGESPSKPGVSVLHNAISQVTACHFSILC